MESQWLDSKSWEGWDRISTPEFDYLGFLNLFVIEDILSITRVVLTQLVLLFELF